MIQVDAHLARFARIRARVYRFARQGESVIFRQDRAERSFDFPDQGFVIDLWHERLKGAVILRIRVCLHKGEISHRRFQEAIDYLQVTLSVHFGQAIAFERERQQSWAMVGTYPPLPEVAAANKPRRANRAPGWAGHRAERRGSW